MAVFDSTALGLHRAETFHVQVLQARRAEALRSLY
jgi:hypothetical protein